MTETVFSHPSKLELIEAARTAGFTVIVMHVDVDTPDLSVARVGARLEEGGHIVPEDKIRARYTRGAPSFALPSSKRIAVWYLTIPASTSRQLIA